MKRVVVVVVGGGFSFEKHKLHASREDPILFKYIWKILNNLLIRSLSMGIFENSKKNKIWMKLFIVNGGGGKRLWWITLYIICFCISKRHAFSSPLVRARRLCVFSMSRTNACVWCLYYILNLSLSHDAPVKPPPMTRAFSRYGFEVHRGACCSRKSSN